MPQQPLPCPESLSLPVNTVMLCMFYWQNDMWIGTNTGLYRYSVNSGVMKTYQYEENNPYSLSQNYITDINLTPDGMLVVATLKGLNLYNSRREGMMYPD